MKTSTDNFKDLIQVKFKVINRTTQDANDERYKMGFASKALHDAWTEHQPERGGPDVSRPTLLPPREHINVEIQPLTGHIPHRHGLHTVSILCPKFWGVCQNTV